MIQLNLLPEVKLEFIKTQRSRRLMIAVAVLVTGVSVVLLMVLLSVSGLQKKHLSDLSGDITNGSRQLSRQDQVGRVLTVQNQLRSLTTLHDTKPAAARLFGYLNQLTPAQVSISSFTMDMTTHAVTITGSADSLSSVNQYVDTLKFTTYSAKDVPGKSAAFGTVVLTSFSLKADQAAGVAPPAGSDAASYAVSLAYDPVIFDITKAVKLSIPNLTTTRSELEKAPDLFKGAPAATPGTTTPATSATPAAGGSN